MNLKGGLRGKQFAVWSILAHIDLTFSRFYIQYYKFLAHLYNGQNNIFQLLFQATVAFQNVTHHTFIVKRQGFVQFKSSECEINVLASPRSN